MVFILEESTVNMTELSATDVLMGIMAKIYDLHGVKKIQLQEPVCVEIANDSDGHRSRVGTMRYTELSLISINGNTWVLALGEKSGGYPGANLYSSDTVAIESKKDLSDSDTIELFSRSIGDYFNNSLLVATVPGYMGANSSGVFGTSVLNRATEINSNLIASEVVHSRTHINLDGTKICEKPATLCYEAINVYTDVIVSILGKPG